MSNRELQNIKAQRERVRKKAKADDAVLLAAGTQLRLDMAKKQLQKYVRRGAALLDQELPSWRKKVDPDELNMENGRRCILGQLFDPTHDLSAGDDGYQRGVQYLFGDERASRADQPDDPSQLHGFHNWDDHWNDDDFPFSDSQHLELDKLLHDTWVTYLEPVDVSGV